MKVLVAEIDNREDGFSWTNPGELVLVKGFVCASGERGRCGCERSFVGVDTRKATTAARVVDMDISQEELEYAVANSEEKAFPGCFSKEQGLKHAKELVVEIREFAEAMPVGHVFRRERHV